jgi:hypothetical protein
MNAAAGSEAIDTNTTKFRRISVKDSLKSTTSMEAFFSLFLSRYREKC